MTPARNVALASKLSDRASRKGVPNGLPSTRLRFETRKDVPLQVLVRDNNVDQALRVLKKKMQREGVFREMKQRKSYEKPSERKNREKSEAIRRARKLARKKAQREGLLPPPKKKPMDDKRGGRPGMGGGMGGDRGGTGGDRGGMGGARPARF
jgi:small subunit ribosomal protein S21